MSQQFLIPQLDEDDQEGRIRFQQDGAPPHYLGEMRQVPRHLFPQSVDWLSGADRITTSFPGSYTTGFFLWGFVNHIYPDLGEFCYTMTT
jgi:hypothetical protein